MSLFTSIRHSPALVALLIQVCSFIAISLLTIVFSEFNPSIFAWAVGQGVLAAGISLRLKMARWWAFIHLFFMPMVTVTLALSVQPIWFFMGFLFLVLIYGRVYRTQVPLYLSSHEVTKALTTLLPKQRDFSFIDLGCGCGGLLKDLSQVQGNGSYYGIEAAPLPYLVSKVRNLIFAPHVTVKWGDFWKNDLARYDVVYAYLSPAPMELLWQKACQEMQPGSMFISNSFTVPGVSPEKRLELDNCPGSTLYMWRI